MIISKVEEASLLSEEIAEAKEEQEVVELEELSTTVSQWMIVKLKVKVK